MNKYLIHLKKYNFLGLISLFINFCYTRIVFGKAFLVRRPLYIRVIGRVTTGRGLMVGPASIIDVLAKDAVLSFGHNVKINHRFHVGVISRIEIGNNVLIGSNVTIIDHNHGLYDGIEQSHPCQVPVDRLLHSQPIIIGERVWIADNVVIMPGVEVGNGSVIGAGAIVTSNVPPNSMVAGVPAKIIKFWDEHSSEWKSVSYDLDFK